MSPAGMLPLLWAQAAPGSTSPPPGPSPVQDADSLVAITLRRWCSSLTLTSPELTPSPVVIVAVAAGVFALFLLAVVAQGPGRAFRQFFDVPGNIRLVAQSIRRVQRSARLIAALLGSTVLVWSAHQMITYNRYDRLDELVLLRKLRSIGEMAFDHGALAALTPLRDLMGLGDNLVLLVAAAVLVFKLSADRWSDPTRGRQAGANVAPIPAWATLCWGGAWVFALYRLADSLVDPGGTPLGGCIVLEAGVLPPLMLMVDGLLLAWVVVELRDSNLGAYGDAGVNVPGILALLPGAMLACLLALPARYAATAVWLLTLHVPQFVVATGLVVLIKGWGLIILQAVAWPFLGMAGGLVWGRGGLGSTLRGYGRLLRAEGGRLAAVALLAAALSGGLSAVAYLVLMTFPASTWLLTAADAYAHYATLPVGLVLLAAMVELGERALPVAALAAAGSTRKAEAMAGAAVGG